MCAREIREMFVYKHSETIKYVKGTVTQIEKAVINDHLSVSKVS